MTIQSTTVFGPTATSPSKQAFVSDPANGPGYPFVQLPVGSIALLGPPVSTLPNPEAMSNVTAVLTAVYNNAQAGSAPNLSPAGPPTSAEYLNPLPTAALWVGASLTRSANSFQGDAPVGGNANWNQVNGETSTEQYLTSVLDVEGVQQGLPAISNVTAISASFGGIDRSRIQVFKWS